MFTRVENDPNDDAAPIRRIERVENRAVQQQFSTLPPN
jgi:hypothetical protein